ncbi:MAG TPA: SRPBCC family protein [Stenomitos sp.]
MSEAPVFVTVSRPLPVVPEAAFEAWLTPELIGQWMFGPHLRPEEVVSIALDARVGGAFSFVVRRNGEEFDHVGEYLEIERPARLGFTWGIRNGDSSRVLLDFAPEESGTLLTLTHELHPDWAHFASRTAEGWDTLLHALAARLEA